MARLGDVVKIAPSTATLNGEQHWLLNLDMVEQQTGRVIEYNYVDAEDLDGSIVQFDADAVLYSKLRPNLNKVVLPDIAGFATSEMLPLVPNTAVLSREYLAYFLRSESFVTWAVSKTAGAKMPRLGSKELLSKEIPLPSLAAQNSIAAQFEKVDTLISLRKQQIAKLDELVKARFVEMFGDPIADSMHWGQVPLSHYLKSIRYGTSTPPSFSETGYEFIRATNIKNGEIVNSDMKFISEEEAQKIEKCKVLGGEMIIVRSGVNAGDTCIITNEHRGQYAGYDMILVFSEELHPVFANVLINTEYMDRVVKPLTRRAAQPHLNSEQVQSLPMIQVPYEQQKHFAAFVAQTDQHKLTIQESLAKLEMLKKALMQKYFG